MYLVVRICILNICARLELSWPHETIQFSSELANMHIWKVVNSVNSFCFSLLKVLKCLRLLCEALKKPD